VNLPICGSVETICSSISSTTAATILIRLIAATEPAQMEITQPQRQLQRLPSLPFNPQSLAWKMVSFQPQIKKVASMASSFAWMEKHIRL
jgi:hypothetical protein